MWWAEEELDADGYKYWWSGRDRRRQKICDFLSCALVEDLFSSDERPPLPRARALAEAMSPELLDVFVGSIKGRRLHEGALFAFGDLAIPSLARPVERGGYHPIVLLSRIPTPKARTAAFELAQLHLRKNPDALSLVDVLVAVEDASGRSTALLIELIREEKNLFIVKAKMRALDRLMSPNDPRPLDLIDESPPEKGCWLLMEYVSDHRGPGVLTPEDRAKNPVLNHPRIQAKTKACLSPNELSSFLEPVVKVMDPKRPPIFCAG